MILGFIHVKKNMVSAEENCRKKEGPAIAAGLLDRLGFDSEVSERVQYLIGHHHTYNNIDGIDYQILVEADFLVNMYEDKADMDTIIKAYDNIFVTESGKWLCRQLFSLEY